MKLFGQVAVPCSKHSNAALYAFLARYYPAAHAVGSFSELPGLSGGALLIETSSSRRLVRHRHSAIPPFMFARQYRALRQLPANLAPHPYAWEGDWLLLDYVEGQVKKQFPPMSELAALLRYLHTQPRFGWRIALLPLLNQYWQDSMPSRRTHFWLRRLRALGKHGEPKPLRLAPLHMDVHPGNIIHTQPPHALRLIDWEYAGDGDIALELAAVWMERSACKKLVAAYAELAEINESTLWQQVNRWRPWVRMVIAGWYEQRFRYTGDASFAALASEVWRQLRAE